MTFYNIILYATFDCRGLVADCFKICSSSTLSPLCIIKVVASESSIQNHGEKYGE